MTLLEITRWALRAAAAGDLEDLARAVAARGEAIASGEPSTPEVIEEGERVCAALQTIRRGISTEATRVSRVKEFLPSNSRT